MLFIVLICEIINLTYYVSFFHLNHFLPAPFFFDFNDTFMDFYNPLYWVIKDGFYTSFNSVYPALNYFFLRLFALAIPSAQVLNPFQLRSDYPLLGILISFTYVLIIWVVVSIGEWRRVNFGHRGVIFLACILCSPILFGIERGNLIFLALLFLALYLNASSLWVKAIFLGCLINIKPYFAILLLQYLNIHNFKKIDLILSILAASVIFLGFGLLAGMDLIHFFKSYILFSKNSTLTAEGVIALPHSIAALSVIKRLIDFGDGSSYTFWFSFLKAVNYFAVIMLLIATIKLPLSKLELLISSLIITTNFSISTGGYVLIIYIVLIPYLFNSREYKNLIYPILIIFTFPLDWIPLFSVTIIERASYLGGEIILRDINYWIGLGSVVRPMANFTLMVFCIMRLLRKYWVDGSRSIADVR